MPVQQGIFLLSPGEAGEPEEGPSEAGVVIGGIGCEGAAGSAAWGLAAPTWCAPSFSGRASWTASYCQICLKSQKLSSHVQSSAHCEECCP